MISSKAKYDFKRSRANVSLLIAFFAIGSPACNIDRKSDDSQKKVTGIFSTVNNPWFVFLAAETAATRVYSLTFIDKANSKTD